MNLIGIVFAAFGTKSSYKMSEKPLSFMLFCVIYLGRKKHKESL